MVALLASASAIQLRDSDDPDNNKLVRDMQEPMDRMAAEDWKKYDEKKALA